MIVHTLLLGAGLFALVDARDENIAAGAVLLLLAVLGLPWSLPILLGVSIDWLDELSEWQYYSLYGLCGLINLILHAVIVHAHRARVSRRG